MGRYTTNQIVLGQVEFMLLEIKRGYIVIGEVSRGADGVIFSFSNTVLFREHKQYVYCMLYHLYTDIWL